MDFGGTPGAPDTSGGRRDLNQRRGSGATLASSPSVQNGLG